MVLPPKDGHKQPDDGKGDKKPESGKDPKQPSTGAKCYSYSIEGGVCKRGGWRYTVITPGIGNGYLCSDTFSPE